MKRVKGYDREEPRRATRDGQSFFSDPTRLNPSQVDRRMRKTVFAINQSGWAWTAQSCAGHPEWNGKLRKGEHGIGRSWRGGRASQDTDPMLKIIVRAKHSDALIATFFEVMHSCLVECGTHTIHVRKETPPAVVTFVGPRRKDKAGLRWRAIVFRFPATNVFERNRGIQVFEEFAKCVKAIGKNWGVAR